MQCEAAPFLAACNEQTPWQRATRSEQTLQLYCMHIVWSGGERLLGTGALVHLLSFSAPPTLTRAEHWTFSLSF